MDMELDANDVDSFRFPAGEPDFTGPPIKSIQFRSYIDSGTFVSFMNQGTVSLGRVISTAVLFSTGLVSINLLVLIEKIDEITNVPVNPISNAYVQVSELIQTSVILHLPPSCITDLILYSVKTI